MNTHPYLQLLAMVTTSLLASCAEQPVTTKVPVSKSPRPDSSLSSQVFEGVNAYRRSQGAKALERHAGLDRLAQQHSEYLRLHRGSFSLNGKNVSHIGFDGRTLVARELYHIQNLSENIAAFQHGGPRCAQVLVRGWTDSKDHRKNMLDKWTHTGVGVVIDADGMVFATELFASLTYSQWTERERFTRF